MAPKLQLALALGLALAACTPTPGLGLRTSHSKPLPPPLVAPDAESEAAGGAGHAADRRDWGTNWCFDAGAPIAGSPALGSDGQVYVATHEGYVHALNAEGAFRWSYTLKGAAISAPQVLPSGSVVVATNRSLLYALKPNGTRLWTFRVPEPISSELSMSSKGTLVFGADAGRILYAVSRHGGVLWRVPIKGGLSAAPQVVADGLVALGTPSGVLLVRGRNQTQFVEIAGARQIVQGPPTTGFGWVLTDAGVTELDGAGGFEHPALENLAYSREQDELVAATSTEVLWLEPQGRVVRRVHVPAELSQSVALDSRGNAYAPSSDGRLLAVGPTHDEFEELARLGSSPLSKPLVDEARARVIAAAGEGMVCAVPLLKKSMKTGD